MKPAGILNTGWPEDSWQITEPDIYYQAAYVYLVSRFVQPLTYQDWAAGHGLSGAATNIYADPDGDGVCNLMEYAFDLSPETPDRGALPQFQLRRQTVNGTPGSYLSVQFPRQLGSTNLTYVVQGSADLRSWSDLCVAAGTNRPTGPGFLSESGTAYKRQVTACDIVPSEQATGARFVRFKPVWN